MMLPSKAATGWSAVIARKVGLYVGVAAHAQPEPTYSGPSRFRGSNGRLTGEISATRYGKFLEEYAWRGSYSEPGIL